MRPPSGFALLPLRRCLSKSAALGRCLVGLTVGRERSATRKGPGFDFRSFSRPSFFNLRPSFLVPLLPKPRNMTGDATSRTVPSWHARFLNGQKPKLLTLLIVHKDEKVLLGKKKRGFGEGYLNGFGGKVEPGETIEGAAVRELIEEAGVRPVGLEKRGILNFYFDDKDQPWEVHVFHAADVVGKPRESEEMAPVWVSTDRIPFDKMWADDIHWYPPFLKGHYFKGAFHFENTHNMVNHQLDLVESLDPDTVGSRGL